MHRPNPNRPGETGAIAILVVLALLSIATVAAVGLSRSSLREALITGNEATGRMAVEMADSGMDYFINWSNTAYTTAPPGAAQAITNNFQTLYNLADSPDNAFTGMNADGTYKFTMLASSVGGDMTPGTTGYLQTTSALRPAFDLEVWYLGHPFASADKRKGRGNPCYLVRSVGRANIGTTGESFVARREGLAF